MNSETDEASEEGSLEVTNQGLHDEMPYHLNPEDPNMMNTHSTEDVRRRAEKILEDIGRNLVIPQN